MEYSYKFRLYPTPEQANLIQRTFGCCRFVYNHYLAKRKEVYENSGKTMNYVACAKDLTLLKKDFKDIPVFTKLHGQPPSVPTHNTFALGP